MNRIKVMVAATINEREVERPRGFARFIPPAFQDRVEVVPVNALGKNVDFVAVEDRLFSLAKEEEIRQYIRSLM